MYCCVGEGMQTKTTHVSANGGVRRSDVVPGPLARVERARGFLMRFFGGAG
jgi:hypothetical protein